MATVTSRKAAPAKAALAKRRATAEKLLKIHVRLKKDFTDMEGLEAELKAIATGAGESFKEQFGADYVGVAPAHGAEFKGNVPVVQTETWLALSPAKREALEKSGLIIVTPQWGKASGGRVTVKTH